MDGWQQLINSMASVASATMHQDMHRLNRPTQGRNLSWSEDARMIDDMHQ